MNKALELAKQLDEIIKNTYKYRKELNSQLSLIDQKRTDVEHVIEISQDKNASEGYNLYRLMRDILRERRTIKDAIDEIDVLMRYLQSRGIEAINAMPKTIEGIENKIKLHDQDERVRTYQVRVMTEVFGEVIQ